MGHCRSSVLSLHAEEAEAGLSWVSYCFNRKTSEATGASCREDL